MVRELCIATGPRILHEYTDSTVKEVCTDLKQWLEQLANVLPLG